MTTLSRTLNHSENTNMTKAKHLLAKGISLFAKDTHFILKSAADTVAHLEAVAVNKLTDIPYEHIIEDRHNETEYNQEQIKNKVQSIKDRLKTKSTTSYEYVASVAVYNTNK